MRSHPRTSALAIGTLLALSLATSASAGLISSFESGLDGWKSTDPTNVTISQDTIGATDGMYSLKVVRTDSMWNNTMENDPAVVFHFQAPWNRLSFDVTAFAADVPAGWLNLTPVLNSQSQMWQQGPDLRVPLDGMPHTLTWDFSTITTPAPMSGWFQLFLPSNSGGPLTYYLDNIRTTTTALPGDANLDGKVDFADLLTLAQNYGGTGLLWQNGDFTGEGNVDFTDLLTLAQHYGQGPAAAQLAELPALFRADVERAFAEAPEPRSAEVVLGCVGLVLSAPRRRN